jgi:hypothetical protein
MRSFLPGNFSLGCRSRDTKREPLRAAQAAPRRFEFRDSRVRGDALAGLEPHPLLATCATLFIGLGETCFRACARRFLVWYASFRYHPLRIRDAPGPFVIGEACPRFPV